jgi:hypothetical protein
MTVVSDELAEKTLAFWNTSKLFHVGEGPPMTISQAINNCNDAFMVLGPTRPLRSRFFTLLDRMIRGRGKRRKTPQSDNVRKLFG